MAYGKLNKEDVVISTELVSTPIWSENRTKLEHNDLNYSAAQYNGKSGNFYLDVYDYTSDTTEQGAPGPEASVQFSLSFASKEGKGSDWYPSVLEGSNSTESRSRTVYGQYRSLLLEDENSEFYLTGTETPSSEFYIISVDRARFKEKLRPTCSLELEDSSTTCSITTGDSTSTAYTNAGRVVPVGTIPSGSSALEQGGCMYLDLGLILIDASWLSSQGILANGSWKDDARRAVETRPYFELFGKIKSISLQSEETVSSNYVFIRVRNAEYNYSTNPTNITGTGELLHDSMINMPVSYITTVGLYNDNNDLVAVAKLSRPLQKDFTKECLIRLKLDY